MTPVNDEELGPLLTETFASHEHLADPDRAEALAASVPPRRRTGPAILVAAAAVAVGALGTAYALSTAGQESESAAGSGPTSAPITRSAAAVTRANHAFAERIAGQALKHLRDRAGQLPGGATEVGADQVPGLTRLNMSVGEIGQEFTRSAFFLAPGRPHQVAQWFAAHPPADVVPSVGGRPYGVGGSRTADGSWSDEVDYDYHLGARGLDRANLASVVQVVRQGNRVGIRFTVFGSWRPGRPGASFVQGVDAVHVVVTDEVAGPNGGDVTHHTWTLTSPSRFQRIVTRFNALPGGALLGISCPAPMATRSYQISFDTSSGTVLARGSAGCGSAVQVLRDGHDIPPYLDGTTFYPYVDQVLSLSALSGP